MSSIPKYNEQALVSLLEVRNSMKNVCKAFPKEDIIIQVGVKLRGDDNMVHHIAAFNLDNRGDKPKFAGTYYKAHETAEKVRNVIQGDSSLVLAKSFAQPMHINFFQKGLNELESTTPNRDGTPRGASTLAILKVLMRGFPNGVPVPTLNSSELIEYQFTISNKSLDGKRVTSFMCSYIGTYSNVNEKQASCVGNRIFALLDGNQDLKDHVHINIGAEACYQQAKRIARGEETPETMKSAQKVVASTLY